MRASFAWVDGAVENLDGTGGAKDNRRVEQRADVLTYTSDTLGADLEVIGPITAAIALQSTLAHVDVFVRLCDVYPSGRSVNLCDASVDFWCGGVPLALVGGI